MAAGLNVGGARMGPEVIRVAGREVKLPLDADAVEALNLGPKWAEDVRKRVAASYYAEGRLSLGQAARLSGFAYADFLAYLRERRIPLDYGPQDLADDVDELKRMGRWDGPSGHQ